MLPAHWPICVHGMPKGTHWPLMQSIEHADVGGGLPSGACPHMPSAVAPCAAAQT
jgi:hypothetical protein